MTNPAIMVGNRTGGQGKTLISQLIHYGHQLAESPIVPVSADTAEEKEKSKLGSILSGVVELGTGAQMSAVRSNQHSIVQYWDRIGELLMGGNCVIDLGANVLPIVFQWAQERQAGKLLVDKEIVLVVPVTAQRQSIEDCLGVFQHADRVRHSLPFSRRVVVLNECHGTFGPAETDYKMKRLSALKASGVEFLTITKANVEIWEQIETLGLSLEQVVHMSLEESAAKFEINQFAALGALDALQAWVDDNLETLVCAGLVPPPVVSSEQQTVSAA